MAKLSVKVACEFETGPLFSHNHETFKTDQIKGKKLDKMLAESDPTKIGFEVWATGDDDFISFVFNRPTGKKGSVIEVAAKPDSSGFVVKIEGVFELKLRSGVAPILESQGANLELRIIAVTSNGGPWSGFSAYPDGVDGENISPFFKTMPKITEFTVK